MFTNADWTHPQIGGLLNEIIVKEEEQLRAPKPRVDVAHVWNPADLKERGSTWKDIQPQLSGKTYQQTSGSQMRGLLSYSNDKFSTSSQDIGSDPRCQNPEASRYGRPKPD